MYRFKMGVGYATLASAFWLTGCVSAPPRSETLELQRSALQRWNACLERYSSQAKPSVSHLIRIMRHDCEGHKRDVIALYPRYLESQIDQMLMSSAHRYVDSLSAPELNSELTSELTSEHNPGASDGHLIQTQLQ